MFYVNNYLQAHMVDDFSAFQDQLWMKIILGRHDYVLLGTIYHSPSQSLGKPVPVTVSAMKKAVDLRPPFILSCYMQQL